MRAWTCLVLCSALCAVPAAACTVSVGSLAFGSIDPLAGAATDSAATIEITCPASAGYTISLGSGAGTYASRRLESGSNYLAYNLYTDASRTLVWGDGTGGSLTVNGMADSNGTVHTVYGRIPSQPTAVPGEYVDAIVVTIEY